MTMTFAVVVIGWIIFRAETIEQAGAFVTSIFTQGLFKTPQLPFCATYIVLMLLVEWFNRKGEHGLEFRVHITPWLRYPIYYVLILMCILCSPSDSEPFIYFQF